MKSLGPAHGCECQESEDEESRMKNRGPGTKDEKELAWEPISTISPRRARRGRPASARRRPRRRSLPPNRPARQIAIYLTRELAMLSYSEIGALFGGRDHSTALYAWKRVAGFRAGDTRLDAELAALTARIWR